MVVILGCAHSGVINTLEYIKQQTDQGIYAVIGGMYLIHATEQQRASVVDYLRTLDIHIIAPLHCSGAEEKRLLANAFCETYHELTTGSKLMIGMDDE